MVKGKVSLKSSSRMAALVVLAIGLLWGLALAGSLPRDWLADNLKALKVANSEDFHFAVLGDSRDDDGRFGEVLRAMDRDREVAFAVHLGDLVRQPEVDLYQQFFGAVQANFRKPLLTVIGNHEIRVRKNGAVEGRALYAAIFGPKVGPFDYTFQVGRHFFVVLDTAERRGPDELQQAWLEGELEKAKGFQNRFVFMHVPLYDPRPGQSHCLPREDADRLLKLFQKYRVTHIFAGHIHAFYQGKWGGIPFVISGGAGAPLRGQDGAHDFFHFTKVRVSPRGTKVSVRKVKVLPPLGEFFGAVGEICLRNKDTW